MTVDLGSDFSCETDLTPGMLVVSGQRRVAEALIRRLGTPRGALWYSPEYGTDLREFVHSAAGTYAVELAAEQECLKEETVDEVEALAEFTANNETMTVTLRVKTSDGPFTLILLVSALRVDELDFLEAA